MLIFSSLSASFTVNTFIIIITVLSVAFDVCDTYRSKRFELSISSYDIIEVNYAVSTYINMFL